MASPLARLRTTRDRLTRAERQVETLRARRLDEYREARETGYTWEQIGEAAGVKADTVEVHLYRERLRAQGLPVSNKKRATKRKEPKR